jgi:hypothetical protein
VSATDLSRRDFARRGALLGAAVAVPGVFAATALAQEGEDTSDTDTEILVRSIGFVQQSVLAYEAAIESKTLADFNSTAAKFAAEERAQEKLLTAALENIGGEALPAPQADSVPGLTQARTREEWLDLLLRTSNQLVAAYIEGQKELGAADLLILSAKNCTTVGQQLVTLRQELGTDPLPSALPSGSEKN